MTRGGGSFRGVFALGIILGMALLCCLGPILLRPWPKADPQYGALLPPGTRVLHLVLESGKEVTTGSWAEEAGGIRIVPSGPLVKESELLSRETRRTPLGTDRFGRDLLGLMLRGGRVSILIALSASFLALLLGLGFGLSSAIGPRWLDALLMRLVDGVLAFPSLLLLILAASLFRPGILSLVLLLGLTSWMGLSRLVRGQALSLKKREYVLAARLAGTPWYRMLAWHYLPSLRGPVAQDTALRVGDLILAEATLSYLGLGLPATMPTWGRLVQEGHRVLGEAWWVSVFPGLAIALLVIAFAMLGDALQES